MRVRRSRTIAAAPEALWAVVSDPWALARWWPGVQRIEDASAETWTQVIQSARGKALRADFTRTEADPPRAIAWRQEVEASPFERFLASAETRISLEPAGGKETRVELQAQRRMRGLALLGGPMVRRATGHQLDEALAGLEHAVGAAQTA